MALGPLNSATTLALPFGFQLPPRTARGHLGDRPSHAVLRDVRFLDEKLDLLEPPDDQSILRRDPGNGGELLHHIGCVLELRVPVTVVGVFAGVRGSKRGSRRASCHATATSSSEQGPIIQRHAASPHRLGDTVVIRVRVVDAFMSTQSMRRPGDVTHLSHVN